MLERHRKRRETLVAKLEDLDRKIADHEAGVKRRASARRRKAEALVVARDASAARSVARAAKNREAGWQEAERRANAAAMNRMRTKSADRAAAHVFRHTMARVTLASSMYWDARVTKEAVLGPRRSRDLKSARRAIIYIMVEFEVDKARIATLMTRHHASICSSCRRPMTLDDLAVVDGALALGLRAEPPAG